jgi:dihydrofolate reductase
MRQLAVNTFMTLDGVMQAPGGPDEDTSGGFSHGGWSVNYWDEAMGQTMDAMTSEPFDLLLGRKTYEIFAAHWPRVTDDRMATALNGATKHVASRTLKSVEWQNSRLLMSDVAEAVAKLKAERGPEMEIHGSGNLIQTLLRNDLIDEFRVWIFPLVLGTGKRLFGEGTMPAGLKLRDSKTSTTGVLMSVFERGGAIDYGSFAREEPTEAAPR